MSQPVDLPVPDVVNPQPSPGLTPPPVPGVKDPVEPTTMPAEPLLEFVAIRNGTEIIHHTRDGQERTLLAVADPERSMWGLDLAIASDDQGVSTDVTGVYVASIGESDELWWFRAAIDGSGATIHERLPDNFQRQSTGGAVEIGNPAPVIADGPDGHVVVFMDGQGSGSSPEDMTFENTLNVLWLRGDGGRFVHEIQVPASTAPLTAEALTVCPDYVEDPAAFEDYPLCLLVRRPESVEQYQLLMKSDGNLDMIRPNELAYAALIDTVALATWTFEDGVARWGVQVDPTQSDKLRLADLDNKTRWIELPTNSWDWLELTINGEYALVSDRGFGGLLVVDLSSGAVAERDMDSSLESLTSISLLWTGPPPSEEQAVMAAEWFRRFANDPDRSWARGMTAPFASSVVLALGSEARTTLGENEILDPDQWTIEPAAGQLLAGSTGTFNTLETLAAATAIDGIRVEGVRDCDGPQHFPRPAGLAGFIQVRIEGTTGDPDVNRCLEGFAVDLFIDEAGDIVGVALNVWES